MSPDGMYYWDGAQWVSTLSPDGRFRWNGASWVPATTAPFQFTPQPTVRELTSWTRPLQYAVAAWYAISAVASLILPFWVGSFMMQAVRASFAQQQAQNPNVAPPPPGFFDQFNTIMTVALWIAAVIGIAIAVLFIVAAIKRWVWAYYVVLVFLGLGVLSGPSNLLNLATRNSYASLGFAPPVALYVYGIVSWFPATALFVFMLVALVKRGPWGMRKVSPAGPQAA